MLLAGEVYSTLEFQQWCVILCSQISTCCESWNKLLRDILAVVMYFPKAVFYSLFPNRFHEASFSRNSKFITAVFLEAFLSDFSLSFICKETREYNFSIRVGLCASIWLLSRQHLNRNLAGKLSKVFFSPSWLQEHLQKADYVWKRTHWKSCKSILSKTHFHTFSY